MGDRRSPEAQEYRRLYKSPRWRRIRAKQLADEPLCRMCIAEGRVTPATVCDHLVPHRGDPVKFFEGPFQSLCDQAPWRCHSSRKQSIERIGYDATVDDSGLPLDPGHPFNR
jgi:hypothetical protein